MTKSISILFLLIFSTITISVAQVRKADTSKAVSFAAIPLLSYNRTTGAGFGLMLSAFFNMNKKDTVSPVSSAGFIGMYTSNKTYLAILYQQMYLKQDRWRTVVGLGVGDINFQFYQDVSALGSAGFIEFNTKMNFAYAEIKRKVYKRLYAGAFGCLSTATTIYDIKDPTTGQNIEDVTSMNHIGYVFSYDTRDNQLSPYKGSYLKWKHSFFEQWLGSGNDFERIELSFTKYLSISQNTNKILVMRATTRISFGDVPFQGQNVVYGDDIRGYTNGKYRDNQLFTTQAEYRWTFYKKWGAVGFLGVATVTDKIADLKDAPFLPGLGVGVRYKMIPSERVNVGIDVAVGKDDWGIYFRIGDTFGR